MIGLNPKANSTHRLKTWVWRCIKVGCWGFGFAVCSLVLLIDAMYLYLDPKNPDTETYRNFQHERPLRIFSSEGALLGEFGSRRLVPVSIDEVPQLYLDAVISTEDKRFYTHQGIDWFSLANDSLDYIFTDRAPRGASTITMQLPRNVADLSRDQTFIRKFREMLLAIKIERELTKDEILELYINVIPFGKHAYGVQAASYTYYGKPVNELNLPQLAMLAGIPKRPEAGNPINNPDWAIHRRSLVLRRMRTEGVITSEEYTVANTAPITARVHRRQVDLQASYPAELARQEAFEQLGNDIYSGYSIYTTISVEQQRLAQQAIKGELETFDQEGGYRGPERRVTLTTDDNRSVETIVRELEQEYRIGFLEPAIVVTVAEKSFDAMLKNGTKVTIPWEGISWARRSYGSAGLGRRPTQAVEVVSRGDVIRVRDEGVHWKLSQVPEVQGALVAIDSRSGAITALVGGYDFLVSQYNHATQAQRQPGSGFKPFVYTAALANGISPAKIYLDAPLIFRDSGLETPYRPRNYTGTYNGPTRLREALYKSINLVSIRVLEDIGATKVREFVTRFGFDLERLPKNTQLAIGGGNMGVSPVEMASAYAVIANGGYRVEPHLVKQVVTLEGIPVFEPVYPTVCSSCGYTESVLPDAHWYANSDYVLEVDTMSIDREVHAERVLDPRVAFLIDSMLRDVVERGTGRRVIEEFGRRDLAGKTGTTNEAVDTWFNGFQQNLVTTTWVGYSDRRSLGESEYGSKRPLSIWIEFMREVLAQVPEFQPVPPDGVVSVYINPDDGEVVHAAAENAIIEYFLAERAPTVGDSQGSDGTNEIIDPEEIF